MQTRDINLFITITAGVSADALAVLLQGVFTVETVHTLPGNRIMQIAPGIIVQVCGEASQPPAYLLNAPQPVLAFRVANAAKAVADAEANGATLLQCNADACTGFRFCYLQLVDGRVVGFFQ